MAKEYRAEGSQAEGAPNPIGARPSNGPHKYKHVFHGPPVTAPGSHVPLNLPEEFAEDLGRHLESLSFITRAELVAMAGPDGMLNVAGLPGPRIRQDPPTDGPPSWLNPGPWVPVSAPEPVRGPVDLTGLDDRTAEVLRAETEAIQEGLRTRDVWLAHLEEEGEL